MESRTKLFYFLFFIFLFFFQKGYKGKGIWEMQISVKQLLYCKGKLGLTKIEYKEMENWNFRNQKKKSLQRVEKNKWS